jgi:hypothetical protein
LPGLKTQQKQRHTVQAVRRCSFTGCCLSFASIAGRIPGRKNCAMGTLSVPAALSDPSVQVPVPPPSPSSTRFAAPVALLDAVQD